MIVPMKKIYVVVQKKDITPALESLRELGSIHVEHQEPLTGFQLEERREEVEVLGNAIAILKSVKAKEGVGQKEVADWTEIVNTILECSAEAAHYRESVAKRQILISRWEPWGHFDLQAVRDLAARGVHIQLCTVAKNKRNSVPQGVALETIYSSGGIDYCLAVSEKEMDLPFEKIALPEASLKEMMALQRQEQGKISHAEDKVKQHLCYLESLERILLERKEVLSFEEVERGMLEDETLAVLKGYCPIDRCGELKARAQKEQWALLMAEPVPGDNIPTLLKNPRWVRLINPVFDFMSIIPGYREADVSFCFLFFFSIFFGMLIGDAGYGLLFFLVTLFLHRKAKAKAVDPTPFYLIYVLSGCAIVWGLSTGTFFGVSLFGKFVKPAVPWLGNEKNVQFLCFVIGAVHLTVAHVWRGLRKLPSLLVLSDVGWIVMVWGAFFYAQHFILGEPLPAFVNPMGYIAFVIIIIFSQSLQDVLKDIPGFVIGIMLTFLTVVSTLIDVISYIRLFAVGTAGVTLAEAFNQMALSAGFHNLFVGLASIFILVVGHLLNIVLGILAIMVHGLRLNILEFSGHLSLEWSGVKYNPFKSALKKELNSELILK